MKKIIIFLSSLVLLFTFVSCNKASNDFELWNDCTSLTNLKEFVNMTTTDEKSEKYIPVEDRIAVFDMDGTLYGELFPAYFEYLLFCHRVLDDKDYTGADEEMIATATLIRNNKYTWAMTQPGIELGHARGQAKAFAGMKETEFVEYVQEFAKTKAEGFNNLTYADATYKPMIEVVNYLQKNDFKTYVVSGSDRFICRALVDSLGIAPNRVIGMDVELKSNNQGETEGVNYTYGVDDTLIRTDNLIIKNLKANKVKQIAQEIGKVPVLSFGNSGGDSAMHNYCLANKQYKTEAFMLIADDEARDHANREKALNLGIQWKDAGYNVISMRDDFKTIYGDNVYKTDFTF